MGADQIGYLVKGPQKIPARRIKAAVRACQQQRKALLADATDPNSMDNRMDEALSATGIYFDPADIPAEPEQEIREFVEWWRTLGGRDTCSRQDPDDARQKLVHAGDMSDGSEPDGEGYQMLKKAFAWGFAEALGVR